MKPHVIVFSLFCLFLLSCSEDDDSNNTTSAQEDIEQIVQSGTFIISSFVDSGEDETGYFSCYAFQFNPNGTVIATSQSNTYNGTWSISGSSSDDDSSDDLDFNLNFNLTNAFEDLNDDWDIVSYSSTTIELIDISGGNGGTDTLVFQAGTPATNCSSGLQSSIQDIVQMGTWRITSFIDSGTDETNDFSGYNFTFESSGTLNANNGTNNYNGTWSITGSNSNGDGLDDLEFNINFNLTNDFEDLNDDWDFISQTATKIELIDINGGNNETDYLTFEKN